MFLAYSPLSSVINYWRRNAHLPAGVGVSRPRELGRWGCLSPVSCWGHWTEVEKGGASLRRLSRTFQIGTSAPLPVFRRFFSSQERKRSATQRARVFLSLPKSPLPPQNGLISLVFFFFFSFCFSVFLTRSRLEARRWPVGRGKGRIQVCPLPSSSGSISGVAASSSLPTLIITSPSRILISPPPPAPPPRACEALTLNKRSERLGAALSAGSARRRRRRYKL